MNFDKHDLYRNVAPGYVFWAVILSFYAQRGQLDLVSTTVSALAAVVAGFPLGVLLHNVYRAFHMLGDEQAKLEKDDGKILVRLFGDASVNNLVGVYETKNKSRLCSNILLSELNQLGNERFKDRNDFLASRFHLFGSLSVAIWSATIALLWKNLMAMGRQ